MNISTIFTILILHYLADFLFQSHKIAVKKYKCRKELFIHGVIYFSAFFFISPSYAAVNAILHCVVDAITSNLTHIAWKKKKYKMFFNLIGLDQTIHILILVKTFHFFA